MKKLLTFFIMLSLMVVLVGCGGSSSDETTGTDDTANQENSEEFESTEIPINQTLEFGTSKVEVRSAEISNFGNEPTLKLNIVPYNGTDLPATVNSIVGFYAFQGDKALNDEEFKKFNSAYLDFTLEPMSYQEQQWTLFLTDTTTPIELTIFPDDQTGENVEGATEMDITIDPSTKTANTEFNAY